MCTEGHVVGNRDLRVLYGYMLAVLGAVCSHFAGDYGTVTGVILHEVLCNKLRELTVRRHLSPLGHHDKLYNSSPVPRGQGFWGKPGD